jgi:hypothetical protein
LLALSAILLKKDGFFCLLIDDENDEFDEDDEILVNADTF